MTALAELLVYCCSYCCDGAVLGDASWVAQTSVICQNPKVTAINTCIEADLTGQVCADSMGTHMYTGNCYIIHVFVAIYTNTTCQLADVILKNKVLTLFHVKIFHSKGCLPSYFLSVFTCKCTVVYTLFPKTTTRFLFGL